MRRALLLALVLAGCARVVPYVRDPQPCQDAAVGLVWKAFGRNDRPPIVWWVPAAAQDCTVPHSGARGYRAVTQDHEGRVIRACITGDATAASVTLIWQGSWALTPLAHELAHAAQARNGLPPDFLHVTAPFRPGGDVEQAQATLIDADLCGPPRRSEMARR